MTAPPPGTQILALIPAVSGHTYTVGAGEPAGEIEMLTLVLPGGHRIGIPGVEGVGIFPWDWAAKLAEAVMEYARLWDPSPDVPSCEDCQAGEGLMCAAHRDQQARSDEFRQLLGWLADLGVTPPGITREMASPGFDPEDTRA